MKKHLLIILISIFSFNCYAQIDFEKGYFINNNDEKVSCLIKNIDWKNNPTEFKYKLSENSEVKIVTIKTAKEFGILNTSKYKRFEVKIDRSSENLNDLSDTKDPIFKEEQLYLKILIEGKATLFSYEDKSLKRYFFSVDDSNIEQLIYKFYKYERKKIGKNHKYKQQLWSNLKCQALSMRNFKNLNYKKKDLNNLFVIYNDCQNSEFTNYQVNKKRKNALQLSIRPGFEISSFSIKNSLTDAKDVNFDKGLGFRIGIEAEYTLPFNKNKWSVFIEPSYQYYNSEKEITYLRTSTTTRKINVKADYKSIELPIGIRHNFFINKNSKLFVNGAYVLDFDLASSIYSERKDLFDYDINSTPNFILGLGYKFKNKYSFEIRNNFKRDITSKYTFMNSNYNKISFIFGYNLF